MNIGQNLAITSSLLAALALPATASVTVNSPVSGIEVQSPFHLSATAVSCGIEKVTSMGYSFDSSPDAMVKDGTYVELDVPSASGPHILHVTAYGENGATCVTDVALTVKAGAETSNPDSVIPSNATTVSSIQSMRNWHAEHDTGGKGRSSGSTSLVSSPSMHGTTRKFETSFSGGGDERFSITYADDTAATHFFYDAWIYVTSSANKVANIEMDTNQSIGGGKVVIYGVQCDGYKNTWDVTENVRSVSHGQPHWQPVGGTHCDPSNWSKDKWHHVQASYSRDEGSSKITYHSVWLDGKEIPFNKTVNGLFDLRWNGIINTQFQIDGRGAGSTTVYLDSLAISRW